MLKPLTIGIDVRDLRVAKTGTLTYLDEVCKQFKQLQSNDVKFKFLDTGIPVYVGKNQVFKLTEHIRYQLWKQIGLPLKALLNGCDIVFCTDNIVPLVHLGYKTIPVFHDAFFFETPEAYGRLWLWLYMKTALPAARRSPYVVTPTQYAKKQIGYYTGIDDSKLAVVNEGPKSLPDTNDNAEEFLKLYDLTSTAYILHVGTLFKRKNLAALVYAFGELKVTGHTNLKLVLAGSTPSSIHENGWDEIQQAIETTGLQEHIIMTGYLPDDKLSLLYKNALMYVFPSVNEGFGIPVLEAFKNNLPVLVANNTCLPEVGGDAVLVFDPFDTEDICQKIKMVADDSKLRLEMITRGRKRLTHFSWRETALQLIELFKKAV